MDGRDLRTRLTNPVADRRRTERRELIETARSWAATLPEALGVEAVVVFGSVARGDFNKWSDIDVLVVSDRLPSDLLVAAAVLGQGAPAGLQPVGWSGAELARRRRRGDPIARQAYEIGVVVRGRLPAVGA